jgi:hypothetical protein
MTRILNEFAGIDARFVENDPQDESMISLVYIQTVNTRYSMSYLRMIYLIDDKFQKGSEMVVCQINPSTINIFPVRDVVKTIIETITAYENKFYELRGAAIKVMNDHNLYNKLIKRFSMIDAQNITLYPSESVRGIMKKFEYDESFSDIKYSFNNSASFQLTVNFLRVVNLSEST